MRTADLNLECRQALAANPHDNSVGFSALMIVVGNPNVGWSLMSPIELADREFKAKSNRHFLQGTVVKCVFSSVPKRFICSVNGTVRWCRKDKEAWQTGVLLESVPSDLLSFLATKGREQIGLDEACRESWSILNEDFLSC